MADDTMGVSAAGGSGSSNAAAAAAAGGNGFTMEEYETAEFMRNTGSGIPQMTLEQANAAIEEEAKKQGVSKEQLNIMEKDVRDILANMDADIQADFTSLGATPDEVLAAIQKQFGVQGGGSRKYRQRGGATWADVGTALRGLGARMAAPFVGAAGAAPDAIIAGINALTLRNLAIGAGWGMAGYGVAFGPPEIPWLTNILWSVVENIPASVSVMIGNTIATGKAVVIQSSLLATIGLYASVFALLVLVLKTFIDMAATGDRNFPRVLFIVIIKAFRKLGILREGVAIAAENAVRDLAAGGNVNPVAAAAAAGANPDEQQVINAVVNAANNAGPPPGTAVVVYQPQRRAARVRASSAGRVLRLTNGPVDGERGGAAAASGQKGGRRRHTRKHHSRRHNRRQSHRRRRISRRG